MKRIKMIRREHVATFYDSIDVSLFKCALDDAITVLSEKYPGIDINALKLEYIDGEYNECELNIIGYSLETDEEYNKRVHKNEYDLRMDRARKLDIMKSYLREHPELREELLKCE